MVNIEKIEELVRKAHHNHPLNQAYIQKHQYYNDFAKVMELFEKALSSKEYAGIINKLQLDKAFNPQKYLQVVSEINVLYYILRKYNDFFKYEPKYNGGFNPECSFCHETKTVNVEVKCPNMEKRIEAEERDTLKIYMSERVPEHRLIVDELSKMIEPNLEKSEFSGVEENFRMDNKLKDYLKSAQDKFPVSDDNNFNVLVISLDIVSDMDEWYSYIFGEYGVFTQKSFVEEKYDKVDAILLTTPVCGHKGWINYVNIDVWKLEETINLLFLCPNREHTQTGKYYISSGIDLFGSLSREFLVFQQKLDMKAEEKWRNSDISPFEQRYIDFKFTDLRIVTEFMEYLKNNCNLQ